MRPSPTMWSPQFWDRVLVNRVRHYRVGLASSDTQSDASGWPSDHYRDGLLFAARSRGIAMLRTDLEANQQRPTGAKLCKRTGQFFRVIPVGIGHHRTAHVTAQIHPAPSRTGPCRPSRSRGRAEPGVPKTEPPPLTPTGAPRLPSELHPPPSSNSPVGSPVFGGESPA